MSTFARKGSRALEVRLDGQPVKAMAGSMVAFEGPVNFKRASMAGGEGIRGVLKRKMTGEGLELMEMSGTGVAWLAFEGYEVDIVDLANQTMQVESTALLAVAPGLRTDVTFTGLRGAASGQGLFTTTVSGTGQVAIITDGPATCLSVDPSYPLVVDPQAFVCSVGQLQQSFVTDISWRNAIGEGNGEAFSLQYTGKGLVYIQPAER